MWENSQYWHCLHHIFSIWETIQNPWGFKHHQLVHWESTGYRKKVMGWTLAGHRIASYLGTKLCECEQFLHWLVTEWDINQNGLLCTLNINNACIFYPYQRQWVEFKVLPFSALKGKLLCPVYPVMGSYLGICANTKSSMWLLFCAWRNTNAYNYIHPFKNNHYKVFTQNSGIHLQYEMNYNG